MNQKQEKWEKEFDDMFQLRFDEEIPYWEITVGEKYDYEKLEKGLEIIKDFLRHAIQTARADLKQEIMEKMPKPKLHGIADIFSGSKITGEEIFLAAEDGGYNQALSEIKHSLEQL